MSDRTRIFELTVRLINLASGLDPKDGEPLIEAANRLADLRRDIAIVLPALAEAAGKEYGSTVTVIRRAYRRLAAEVMT